MIETSEDFSALLARARAGDGEALTRLVQEYEPKVRVVARVLLGPALRPHLDSLDLVQSVHRSLLVGLRANRFELSGPEKLVALAVTLLRRKAARHWRHLQRQRRPEGGPDAEGGLPSFLAGLSSPEPDPARQAELRDAVLHLYSRLSEQEQRILELRAQGYQTGEVARDLGINPIALRVRLTRLRQRLHESGADAEWL